MFSALARDYMSPTLFTVDADTPLREVERLLQARELSCAVILGGDGGPAGLVSVTDLLRAALEPGSRERELVARDVMSTSIIGIDETQTVRDAAVAMVMHSIHRVLVSREGRAIAVLSTRDVLRAVRAERSALPLGQVMTSPVTTIDLGAPVDEALGLIASTRLHGLVVTEGERPVGVFTEVEALRTRGLPASLLHAPLEEVMSYRMQCLEVSTPLYRVAAQLLATRARRVLAMDGGRLVGIATGLDIARVATLDDEAR